MTVKIIVTDNKYSRRYIKKKTNLFFKCKNKDWVALSYFFGKGILFQIFNKGVLMDSLDDTDKIYNIVHEYIEFLFLDTEIFLYGKYDEKRFSEVKGVRVTKL